MVRLGALLAIVAGAAALALSGVAGSTPTGDTGWRTHSSERYRFSLSLPPGWRLSPKRLVPKLLMPREILSAGTFPMPVGGGGNCGRYPIAAIERMRSGDALVSVQEYAVNSAMRALTGTRSAPPPRVEGARELRLRRELRVRGAKPIPAGQALWSATLPFSDHGRWFDALVFVRGQPTSVRVSQIRSILDRLRFGAGSRVELSS